MLKLPFMPGIPVDIVIVWGDQFMGIVLITTQGATGVTLLPPTSEAGVRFPARPQVGKLVVACRWSAVYVTEP